MSVLAPLFLWLLPLAGLPILIHLLNRLRYRTVRWAAMMFLRRADRESVRRARVRQWLILAARCLMLLAFVLTLTRPQWRGALSRFLDPGVGLVVVLFDRSASMEARSGAQPLREHALARIEQALADLSSSSRVLWLDSATRSLRDIPPGARLGDLDLLRPSSTGIDLEGLLRLALEEITRAAVPRAEIWIASDLQNLPPRLSELDALVSDPRTVLIRHFPAPTVTEPNRALAYAGPPYRDETGSWRIPVRVERDPGAAPETLPLTVEWEGMASVRELDLRAVSTLLQIPVPEEPRDRTLRLRLRLPADANSQDNELFFALAPERPHAAWLALEQDALESVCRAGLLEGPSRPVRRWTANSVPEADARFLITDQKATAEAFADAGGIALLLPAADAALEEAAEDLPFVVGNWNEASGPLRVRETEDVLRLDLLEMRRRIVLPDQADVLVAFADDAPMLTRTQRGPGRVYRLATLPTRDWSNLSGGWVWLPLLQGLLEESLADRMDEGTHLLGTWRAPAADWVGEPGNDPAVHAGFYQAAGRWVALNPPPEEAVHLRAEPEELVESLAPFVVRVFDAETSTGGVSPRVEITRLLAMFALVFLAVESLLVAPVRRKEQAA